MIEFKRGHFYMALRSFESPSHALVVYHMERGGMPLHDAVGVNCKRGLLLKIKVQVPDIWGKGHMCLMIV